MDVDIKNLILEALIENVENENDDNTRQRFEFPSLDSSKDKRFIKALKDIAELNPEDVNEDDIKRIRTIAKHFSSVVTTISLSREERKDLLDLLTAAKKLDISARVPETIYDSYVFVMKYGKHRPLPGGGEPTEYSYDFSPEDRRTLEKRLRSEIKKIKEDVSFLEMEEEDRRTIEDIIKQAEKAIPEKEKTADQIERKSRTGLEKSKFATTMISLLVILSRNVPYFFNKKFNEFSSDEQKKYNQINNKYIAVIKEYELDKEWDAINDRIKNNPNIISSPQGVEPDVKTLLNFAHLIFDHMDYEEVLEEPSGWESSIEPDDFDPLYNPAKDTPREFPDIYTFQGAENKDFKPRINIVGIKPYNQIKTLKDMRDKIHDIFFDVETPQSDEEQTVQPRPQQESIKRIIVNEFMRYLDNKR